MQHAIIPPREPQHEPIRPPMIYVEKQSKWEYKQIVRDLEKESAPDEAELNALGVEGWEMTGVAQQPPLAYFYFKRQIENRGFHGIQSQASRTDSLTTGRFSFC